MINTEKALHSIIKCNEYRDWTHTPFTIGDHVYSTDAHTLIKLPKNSVGTFDKKDKEPYSKKIIELFDVKYSKILDVKVSELKEAVAKVPLVYEYRDVYEEGNCTECDGYGEVEWEYESYTRDMDCPVCCGEGKLSKEKRKKTGLKIKSKDYYININFNRLRTVMIEELIVIADYLEVDNIEVVYQSNPNTGIIFKVGVAEVMMMPVLMTDEQNVVKHFVSIVNS